MFRWLSSTLKPPIHTDLRPSAAVYVYINTMTFLTNIVLWIKHQSVSRLLLSHLTLISEGKVPKQKYVPIKKTGLLRKKCTQNVSNS